MRVARTIASFLTAMALALAMVLQATPTPAVAVTGYDSAFLFESDWLIVKPGDTGQAAVTFLNVGSVSWQKGGASQVNLATCCPLNSPPTHAAWLVTPLSSTAYATHREDLVAPGGRGTYIWNFKVPDNAAAGIYDFPGDLVLASTGEGIHREGYFHRNDNRPAAAPAVAPTKTDLTPDSVNGTLGANVTLTAEVTGDPETGSTTRRPVVGIEVTFVVDAGANDVGNSDFTRTATTDANGKATLTYTRSNPGTDTIAAYPTQFPTVRDTSTVQWSVAGVVTVTPDDPATLQNTQCRTYTVTVKSATTGAVRSGVVVDAAIKEDIDAGKDKLTTVTINGTNTTHNTSKELTATDSNGVTSFTVCGASEGPATPIAWLDNTPDGDGQNDLDSNEFRDTGGSVTFQGIRATFTLDPQSAADAAIAGRRVYTITATDQFGGVFTGAVQIGFVELTDASTTTTTAAWIDWVDNDTSLQTSTTSNTGVIRQVKDTQRVLLANLNSSGKAAFAITCGGTDKDSNAAAACASGTVGTPIVWQEIGVTDNIPQTDEPQKTGGATTFKTAALTSSKLRAETGTSSATNPTSTGEATPLTDNASFGEEIYKFTLTDQSGKNFTVTAGMGDQDVTFNVKNTGSGKFFILNLGGDACATCPIEVAIGATVTVTGKILIGQTDTTFELDSVAATSAEITANLASNASITATATKTWVAAGNEPTTGTVEGEVTGFDTAQKWYLVKTSIGSFFIEYANTDNFKVAGTSTSVTTFEAQLSVGDKIKFTDAGATDTHEITTDNP